MKHFSKFKHFKKEATIRMRLGNSRVVEQIEKIKYRIKIKKILDSCPDEYMRRQMMARIEAEERRLEIQKARITSYQKQISIGFLDMVEALVMVDCNEPKANLTAEQKAEANKLFKEGKSRFLMYSRWMGILDPSSCAVEWAKIVEPINIDTFDSDEAWLDFFNNLPIY